MNLEIFKDFKRISEICIAEDIKLLEALAKG